MNSLCLLMDSMCLTAKIYLNRFLRDEDGEVNVVATVLLIAVAVGLVLLLKDEVAKLISGIFSNLDTSGLSSKPTGN